MSETYEIIVNWEYELYVRIEMVPASAIVRQTREFGAVDLASLTAECEFLDDYPTNRLVKNS